MCWFFNCKESLLSSSMISYNRLKTVDKSTLLLFLFVHGVALWVNKPNLVQRCVCVCVGEREREREREGVRVSTHFCITPLLKK